MKIITILFCFSLMICDSETIDDKYVTAYNYLNNCEHLKSFDKKLCKKKNTNQFPINVIEEVYPLSILIFNNDIIRESIMKDKDANDKEVGKFMLKFDKVNDFEPLHESGFNNLFPSNKKSQIFVAFSKPVGNLLFAELAYNLGCDSVSSIRELTRFNTSLSVLFEFDGNGKIKEVRTNINQYD